MELPATAASPGSRPGGSSLRGVEFRTLPACTVLSYVHGGLYTELGRSYAIETFMDRESRVGTSTLREIYETSPEEVPDPADWLTELRFPIVRDDAYGLRH